MVRTVSLPLRRASLRRGRDAVGRLRGAFGVREGARRTTTGAVLAPTDAVGVRTGPLRTSRAAMRLCRDARSVRTASRRVRTDARPIRTGAPRLPTVTTRSTDRSPTKRYGYSDRKTGCTTRMLGSTTRSSGSTTHNSGSTTHTDRRRTKTATEFAKSSALIALLGPCSFHRDGDGVRATSAAGDATRAATRAFRRRSNVETTGEEKTMATRRDARLQGAPCPRQQRSAGRRQQAAATCGQSRGTALKCTWGRPFATGDAVPAAGRASSPWTSAEDPGVPLGVGSALRFLPSLGGSAPGYACAR